MEFQLNAPLARNGNADTDDVRRVKKALNRLGYYQPYEKVGITDIADAALFEALKTFQKDQGLTPSGAIKPGDDTEQALARESAKTPSGYYIWRTVEDDKVRGAHAALNRTVREWDDSPDPGEDFNCRCWAEPVEENIYPDAIQPVYPEYLLVPALRAKNIANFLKFSTSAIVQKIHSTKIKMEDTLTWPTPPIKGRLKEGLPSRTKPRSRGEKSLYDENGGEWRYSKENQYHNPHWDYKPSTKSKWENIPINNKPPHK